MEDFLGRFNFRPEGAMLVGLERECFLTNSRGVIVPIAFEILQRLKQNGRFGYELSACQLEDRVGPCQLKDVREAILENEEEIRAVEGELDFQRLCYEVAPDNMPLDVYPDPTGRYQEIIKKMPQRVLLAACQVIATHVHIGMPDHETALRVYNQVIEHCDRLCQLGDGSNGRRLEIYKIVAPDFRPPAYRDWDEFYQEAQEKNFVDRPRDCWHIIRLSVHGTIEFRMFGATENLDKIINWATECHQLCEQALSS